MQSLIINLTIEQIYGMHIGMLQWDTHKSESTSQFIIFNNHSTQSCTSHPKVIKCQSNKLFNYQLTIVKPMNYCGNKKLTNWM